MDGKSAISITIINRYYPPDSSVTAEAASDLALHLIQNNMEVHIVSANAN